MKSQLCLEWKNLSYSVPRKTNAYNLIFCKNDAKSAKLKIINNVSGSLNTGDLIAIIGASGAGKTTLLAAISKRIRGNTEGNIYLNRSPIDHKEMARISCYLPQFEITLNCLTAFEHLYFMCYFKMSKKTNKFEKVQKVNDLLLKVGLSKSANTRVANLSGGEKKRLCLAEELISNPRFIFCDEPTTGLDSYNASSVISSLQQLTKHKQKSQNMHLPDNIEMEILSNSSNDNGAVPTSESFRKGIICSIHQPTSDIFEMFTHLILLSDGHIVYQGSTDDACLFFSKLGLFCPRNFNPAEFYIALISNNNSQVNYSDIIRNNYEQEMTKYGEIIQDQYHTSIKYTLNPELDRISWLTQIYVLIWRCIIQTRRNFKEIFIQNVIFLMTAVILALMYSNQTAYNQASVQNVQGALFLFTTEIIFTASYSILYVFPEIMPKLRREIGENTISLSAFYISEVIYLIPKSFIVSYAFTAIVYPSIRMSKGFSTLIHLGFSLSLSYYAGTAYGFLLSSAFESTVIAVEVAVVTDLFLLMFGGVYYNVESVPLIKYISVFFYSNEALAYNFWNDVHYIDCSRNTTLTCMRNGTEVLQNYAFRTQSETVLFDYAGLGVIFLFEHFVAYMFVSRYVNKSGYY